MHLRSAFLSLFFIFSLQAQERVPSQAKIKLIGDDPKGTLHATRFAGHSDLKKVAEAPAGSERTSETNQYLTGIIAFAAIGILFMILTFWSCCCFCCCRCCCKKKCGGKYPREEGYSKKARFIPLIIMLVFAALVTVFCILGYVANADVTAGFQDDDKSVTKTFRLTFKNMDDVLSAIIVFIDQLLIVIMTALDNVKVVVAASSPILKAGTLAITDQMDLIADTYDNRTVETNGKVFICQFCTDIASRMRIMKSQVVNATDKEFKSFDSTLNDTDKTFLQTEANVRDNLNKTKKAMFDMKDTVAKANNEDDIKMVEGYDKQRQKAVNGLFALPLLSLIAVVIGGIIRKGFVFTINYLMGFISLYIIWLCFTVHAPISAVVADVCVLLDEYEKDNWMIRGVKNDSTRIIRGCFNDTPLNEVFNISLEFGITFPNFSIDVDSLFNFSGINNFTNDVNNLGTDTFGGVVDEQLTTINAFPDVNGTFYDRTNLSLYEPVNENETDFQMNATYYGRVALKNGTLELITAEADSAAKFQEIINNISRDTGELNNNTERTKAEFKAVVASMSSLESHLDPVSDKINNFSAIARCGFLPERYQEMHDAVCIRMLGGLGSMVLAFFLIGLFLIPLVCLSIKLKKRIGRPKSGDYTRQKDSSSKATTAPPPQIIAVQQMPMGTPVSYVMPQRQAV